ncbi:OmpA family protein [Azonexus sp.]|uniref:OmpA family protein n=1 Tax=Azonexus sp. TaxID=1872668 RepID=UPI0027B992CC|nr:OmpA family protein [Azonexus sp.]
MSMIRKALMVGFLGMLLTGCASKSYVVLLDNPDGSTGKIVVRGEKGEQLIDKSMHGAALDGSQQPAAIEESRIRQDFGAAMAARPQLPERFLLYFELGGATLTAESQALLAQIIRNAASRPAVDVSIIGHTDTSGNAEQNSALALKRAQSVAELMQQQGLKAHALIVESHGERNLLIQTPDETPEPRNRRVEISLR